MYLFPVHLDHVTAPKRMHHCSANIRFTLETQLGDIRKNLMETNRC